MHVRLFCTADKQKQNNKHCEVFVQLELNVGAAESRVEKWKRARDPAALLPEFSCTDFAKGTSCLTEPKPFCCFLFL